MRDLWTGVLSPRPPSLPQAAERGARARGPRHRAPAGRSTALTQGALAVGFDAARAFRNRTGLGNYSRRLLTGLAAAAPELSTTLYAPAAPRPEFAPWIASLARETTICLPPTALRAAPMRQYWRTFRTGHAARRDGVQLYHGLSHEMPRDLPGTGIPAVVTFHDLLFERYPDLFPAVDRMSYRWRYRWSAEHAAQIVAVSGQTRDDLVKWYGVDPARVTIIPPARDPAFALPTPDPVAAAVRTRLGLPREYLLSVGTLERRKNHRVLVEALALLDPVRTPVLVIVGRDGGEAAALRKLARGRGVAARILMRHDVAAGELPALYQGASLFLYPSLFEGFGMPIVEALSAGVPVITTAGGCFPEAGGPATRYVTSTDAVGLAGAIQDILGDPQLAGHMRDEGRRWAQRFDAMALAAPLLHLYHSVLH